MHDTERWRPEPAKAAGGKRSPYQRDRARVLHSAAFRRLAAKTQVVGVGVDDFPRTRLTHSLECAQIGRELADSLGADPDLVDAACLAHDLGHPPFGHNGEVALDEAARDCGGFEGNAQSLRVLTRLEHKVEGAGLNLTRAVLDATVKYPWARGEVEGTSKFGVYADDRSVFDWLRADAPVGQRRLEATVMDWADDVAYSVHDLEDGVQAGQVDLGGLATPGLQDDVVTLTAEHYLDTSADELHAALDRLLMQPWWPAGYTGSGTDQAALKRATSELIGRFCSAALVATRERYGDGPLAGYDAELVVPDETRAECAVLKGVTALLVMRRAEAVQRQEGERALMHELVERVEAAAPAALEPDLAQAWERAEDDCARRRVVVDQVAGLTDTSAHRWRERLAGSTPSPH
jgi:dGTPase